MSDMAWSAEVQEDTLRCFFEELKDTFVEGCWGASFPPCLSHIMIPFVWSQPTSHTHTHTHTLNSVRVQTPEDQQTLTVDLLLLGDEDAHQALWETVQRVLSHCEQHGTEEEEEEDGLLGRNPPFQFFSVPD
mgnify:CR=1 FL=1